MTEENTVSIYDNPNFRKDVAVNIAFDTRKFDDSQMQKLYEVEKLLGELGVHSDTGSSIGDDGTRLTRDWQWDWSLHGPIKVTFSNFTDDDPKNRYVRADEKPVV